MAEERKTKIENVPGSSKSASSKTVYVQDDVFVHTCVTSSYSANIIRGQISIVEKDDSSHVNWLPVSPEAVFDDYHINNDAEWSVVSRSTTDLDSNTQQPENQHAQNVLKKYTLSFATTDLNSIRRSDSKFHWHFLVFVLKDGTTLPALHFHSGGTAKFIQHLHRYVWLTKSSNNPRLFIVCNEHNHALQKSLNHLDLFGSDTTDMFTRFLGNAYVEGLGAFSKVTKMVRDVWTNGPAHESYKPTKPEEPFPPKTDQNYDSLQSLENGFETLLPDVQPDLGPATDVVRGDPISLNEWMSYTDSEGKICKVEKLKQLIRQGGIEHSIRKDVWKFLLGFYDYEETYKERIQKRKRKWNEYITMKQQWQSITPEQEKRFTLLRERKHLVDKDVIRTDRTHSFYKEDPANINTQKLYDILMTYCMYNFDLGYVQGMSDLLSPILFIMNDESDAFWCFVGFMEMVADNFEMNAIAIHRQLDNLKALLQYVYPRLYHHFDKNESGNLYFCFRWLLILFKREFVFEDIMKLWETLWTQNLSPNFHLFVCLAILKTEEDHIIEKQYGFNEILKHVNELAMKIDLEAMLVKAEKLCVQLRDTRNLPDDITEILMGKPVERSQKRHFPGKPVLVSSSNDGADAQHQTHDSDDDIEELGEELIKNGISESETTDEKSHEGAETTQDTPANEMS